MTDEAPKIIIDEDWKTQAQREKEELERKLEAQQEAQHVGDAGHELGPLPPATLTTWLTTVATQASMSLGQMPNPFTGEPEIDLEQAKYYIDTLQMLEDKTAGNRTDEESRLLTSLLHTLRLAYLDTGRELAERATPKA